MILVIVALSCAVINVLLGNRDSKKTTEGSQHQKTTVQTRASPDQSGKHSEKSNSGQAHEEVDPPPPGAIGLGQPASQKPHDVVTAQQRAMALYPDLARADSPLNKEFVARYRIYKKEAPRYFDDPEWPTKLAKEILTKSEKRQLSFSTSKQRHASAARTTA